MKVKQFEDVKLWVRDEKDWGFWQNDNFEPEETQIIKSIIKPDWTCLDIGANIGYFTILMAKRCKLVRAYEAETSNYQQLVKNILLNQTLNVLPSRIAVTEYAGQGMLHLSDVNNGMHRIYRSIHCNGAMIVKTQRLDNIWNELEQFPVNFIKMDIEGSELGALRGMTQILEKCRPTMIMEYHPMSIEESGANPKDIYDLLMQYYDKICLIPNIKEHFSYEDLYLQTNDPSGGRNIFCQ